MDNLSIDEFFVHCEKNLQNLSRSIVVADVLNEQNYIESDYCCSYQFGTNPGRTSYICSFCANLRRLTRAASLNNNSIFKIHCGTKSGKFLKLLYLPLSLKNLAKSLSIWKITYDHFLGEGLAHIVQPLQGGFCNGQALILSRGFIEQNHPGPDDFLGLLNQLLVIEEKLAEIMFFGLPHLYVIKEPCAFRFRNRKVTCGYTIVIDRFEDCSLTFKDIRIDSSSKGRFASQFDVPIVYSKEYYFPRSRIYGCEASSYEETKDYSRCLQSYLLILDLLRLYGSSELFEAMKQCWSVIWPFEREYNLTSLVAGNISSYLNYLADVPLKKNVAEDILNFFKNFS